MASWRTYCTPSKVKVVAHPGVVLTAASLVSFASFAAAVDFRVERRLGFLAGDFSSTGSTSSSCSAALESLSSVKRREVRSDSTRRNRVNKKNTTNKKIIPSYSYSEVSTTLAFFFPFPGLVFGLGGVVSISSASSSLNFAEERDFFDLGLK